MELPATSELPAEPRIPDRPAADGAGGAGPLERLASFRFTYLAIFLFLLFSVLSIGLAEALLQVHFVDAMVEAATVDASEPRIVSRIQERVDRLMRDSAWIRLGGVRVRPILLGADGRTLLYAGGAPISTAPGTSGIGSDELWLLPPTVDVQVSVPLGSLLANAILVTYFGVLVTTLIVYTRTLTRREAVRLSGVISARDQVANRARQIESELAAVRGRLLSVEPDLDSQAGEIRSLEEERTNLLARLSELERREEELRGGAAREGSLQEERTALEELLEEALSDLDQKDQEIQVLQREVKRAGRSRTTSSKESELLARRLRTLYKHLEIDDRASQDLVGLRDEVMKLKAEEAVKRLSDEPETAAVRRKVGGLPPHLSIFELGFAGKGRIYYTRGRQRRYRILAVGAKNTQKTDLEYLSRLPREDG